jgi:hypothetical protein
MAKGYSGDRRRYWREVIQRQQASGQSIEKFCVKEKLGKATFYAWKRRLRKAGKVSKAAHTTARPTLVPVQIINDRPDSIVNDRPDSIINDRPDSIVNDRPDSIINDRPDDHPASTANLEVQWPDGVLLRVQGCEVRVVKAVVAAISASLKRRGQSC